MDQSNILALDVGERRIGVAVASKVARLAAPVGFIDRLLITDVFEEIKRLVKQHSAGTIIVGLPRGMNGQETQQTLKVRGFAHALTQVLDQAVILQDEAGTSLMAEERLKARKKPYDKGDIDAEAACLILHDWLNQQVGNVA